MGSASSLLRSIVFQPPPDAYRDTPNLVKLETRLGNTIRAYYYQAPGASDRPVLIFSHGNAEDLSTVLYHLKDLANHIKVNIVAYDYSGYGLSTGEPSPENFFADIEAVYKFTTDILDYEWHQVIPYARSIGSGPSLYLAENYNVRGVILQSPLKSIFRVPFDFRFTLPGDMFPNIARITRIPAPTLVIHGTKDEIVPFQHGLELHRAAKNPVVPLWVDGGGHNNLELVAGEDLARVIQAFVDKLCAETPPAALNHAKKR